MGRPLHNVAWDSGGTRSQDADVKAWVLTLPQLTPCLSLEINTQFLQVSWCASKQRNAQASASSTYFT